MPGHYRRSALNGALVILCLFCNELQLKAQLGREQSVQTQTEIETNCAFNQAQQR